MSEKFTSSNEVVWQPPAFSAPCPAIAADVFNKNVNPVCNHISELVVKAPWIGMARGFWKDADPCQGTYWSRFPNVWVHGDFAAVYNDGRWYRSGCSDALINVAGKCLGPAEVEYILVVHPAVTEAAAIGVPDPIKGNAVVVFCVTSPEATPLESLRDELIEAIITSLGKPLAPCPVIFVSDLFKTRNTNVMRRMICAAYLGNDLGGITSLVNPESVSVIQQAK